MQTNNQSLVPLRGKRSPIKRANYQKIDCSKI